MASSGSPVAEKPLSPVLNTSRSFRKVLHVKKKTRRNVDQKERVSEENLSVEERLKKLRDIQRQREQLYDKVASSRLSNMAPIVEPNDKTNNVEVSSNADLLKRLDGCGQNKETRFRCKTDVVKKNIFGNENFDDLKSYDGGFQKTSAGLCSSVKDTNLMIPPNSKFLKNIFGNENFDDLKLDEQVGGFQKSSTLTSISSVKVKSKNIFAGECFDDIQLPENVGGFQKCSLVVAQNDSNSLPKLKNIFGDENFSHLKSNDESFQKTSDIISLKATDFSKTSVINAINPKFPKNIFGDENFDDLKLQKQVGGFQKSSSVVSSVKRKVPKNIFPDEQFDDIKLPENLIGFQKCSLVLEKTDSLPKPKNIFADENFADLKTENGFTRASCKSFDKLGAFRNIFGDENFDDLKSEGANFGGFVKASEKTANCFNENHSEDETNEGFRGFSDSEKKLSESLMSKFHKRTGQIKTVDQKVAIKNFNNSSFLRRPKKRLGVHASPSIAISEKSLKRAKLMFENEFASKLSSTSTPVKTDAISKIVCDLTPIQKPNNVSTVSNDTSVRQSILEQTLVNDRFKIQTPSDATIDDLLEDLQKERKLLQEKLRLIDLKKVTLIDQQKVLSNREQKVKAKPGVLYVCKTTNDRRGLKTIPPSRTLSYGHFLYQINPENAAMVHFNLNDKQPVVQTLDGARVVPNINNQIGLCEIERSFRAMDGVEPALIPNGWIKNHYKWIVWKLASYERKFPDTFDGCLNVENVIQHIKYRYDREIDKAERSAIRKILEKDDCAQKRMVLCVSKISKVKQELELTDGWYSIRTVIDKPLSHQIARGRLKVGTKIITCGSELFNCEGCSPLEVTDVTYLAISYNSTRRAAWWSKLGYQRDPSPFSVPLSGVDLDGGRIGCVRFYIARAYPLKYLEKVNGQKVWRNERAEERRAQEWLHEIENAQKCQINEPNDIRDVKDGQTLFYMLQCSKDPEGFQERLTESQKQSLLSYRIPKNDPKRDVTPLFKLKVLDCTDQTKEYAFHVWRPAETHLQELKEGQIVTAFNLTCSRNWGISAVRSSQFRCEPQTVYRKFEKFRRKVTLIDDLRARPIFNEFDTVGVLLKKRIGSCSQDFWLVSLSESLLLVHINEPAQNIRLLDNLVEGEVVAVCNLTYQQAFERHVSASADHSTIMSKYSKYKHLQEASEILSKELGNQDTVELLKRSRETAERIEEKLSTSSNLAWEHDDMDSSQLTSTDIALMECINKLT